MRRSTLQGLMVVGLIVEEILNVDAKYVKVTGAQNIGQGHRVKVPAKSVSRRSTMQGLVLCSYLERQRKSKSMERFQGHWVNISAKSGGQGDVSCKV